MKRRLWILMLSLLPLGMPANLKAYAVDEISDDATFDGLVEHILQKYNIPSLQACILSKKSGNWETVWSNTYGYRQAIWPKLEADGDTIYNIGSTTKTYVATAVMQLVERELIHLDQPVNELMPIEITNPHFPNTPITVRHLLTHRAGLAYLDKNFLQTVLNFSTTSPFSSGPLFEVGMMYPLKQLRIFGVPVRDNSVESWLNATDHDGDFVLWRNQDYQGNYFTLEPGTATHYSNAGYIILGYLIEQVINSNHEHSYGWNEGGDTWKSGATKTWMDYVYKKILAPLGLTNTRFYWADYDSTNFAREYTERPFVENSEWTNADPRDRETIARFIPDPHLPPIVTATFDMFISVSGPAGTMKSTAEELGRFFTVLVNQGVGYKRDSSGDIIGTVRILSPKSVEIMQTLVGTDMRNDVDQYGIGWSSAPRGGRYWTSVWNSNPPSSEAYSGGAPEAGVNWGDPTNPAEGTLRYAGFEPINLEEGWAIEMYGNSGDTAGTASRVYYIPSQRPDNDLMITFLMNENFSSEYHDESQMQPLKFEHYTNFFDGAPTVYTPEQKEQGYGMLPHAGLKDAEVTHLLFHKGVTLLD